MAVDQNKWSMRGRSGVLGLFLVLEGLELLQHINNFFFLFYKKENDVARVIKCELLSKRNDRKVSKSLAVCCQTMN